MPSREPMLPKRRSASFISASDSLNADRCHATKARFSAERATPSSLDRRRKTISPSSNSWPARSLSPSMSSR